MTSHRRHSLALPSALLLAALAFSLSGIGRAQGLGMIVGTVTDPSGALVPGAVRVIDEGTSQGRQTTTNAQGYYVFPSLRRSNYSVTVEASGFAPSMHKGVLLQADQSETVNFDMSVEAANHAITVEAPVHQADTSTRTLSEVIDPRQIVELP